jgi:hypothetical protein
MKETVKKTIGTMVMVMMILAAGPLGAAEKPLIQLAILLDTSNSMDGLIDQARTQLWKIVNELALARREGMAPTLEVALYEYGNDGLPAERGHIRLVSPFTQDLDLISERLFALGTNGGSEFCGQVIGEAVRELGWSRDNKNLKFIFIAGNEEFTQGTIDFRTACPAAIQKGIVVNTIFCGGRTEGIAGKWKEGADLADGRFMAIDQSRVLPDIKAPQDAEIAGLNAELNKTYIAYGARGGESKMRQAEQDLNAAPSATVTAQRVAAKASVQYSNAGWDLVDARREGSVQLDKMKDEDLPAEMKGMKSAERVAYVEKMAGKRAGVQARIRKLAEARDAYVAVEMKKLVKGDTLDAAVLAAVREQARKKNYTFSR